MSETSRCKFCRISFNSFKNHVYSDSHKRKVLSILKKFKSKVKQAKVFQKNPEIESSQWERNCNFWCHFCEEENEKHSQLDDEATIKYGGFLRHLSESSHAEKVEKFWCSQRLRDQKTESYTLIQEKFQEFERKASTKVKEFVKVKEDDFAKKLSDFKHIESKRQEQLSQMVPDTPSVLPGKSFTQYNKFQGQFPRGYRTVAAKGEGLTCIDIGGSSSNFNGNIYSGATPPWLREESSTRSTDNTIGPTQQDYVQHLEEEKRRKLPAHRVGASTIESEEADWMPAFGRVWSKQSRQQQRKWPFKGLGAKTTRNTQSMPYVKKGLQQKSYRNSSNGTVVNSVTSSHSVDTTSVPNHRTNIGVDNGVTLANTSNFHQRTGDGGYVNNEQQYVNPEQQYVNPEQYVNGEQQSVNRKSREDGERLNGHMITCDTITDRDAQTYSGLSGSNTRAGGSLNQQTNTARPYERKKHSNNVGLGKIEISQNLL